MRAHQHNEAAKNLCSRLEKGCHLFKCMQPQPWLGLQRSENADYLRVENCVFCGLGFDPVWATRSVSCQHMYHEWCCWYVFETSTTCVAAGCGVEMHEGWWVCASFVKPGATASVENTTNSGSGQTSAQPHAREFLPSLLHNILIFMFVKLML
jgi:hypothetical protein